GQRRLAPEDAEQALILVGLEAVLGDDVGGDLGSRVVHAESGFRARALIAPELGNVASARALMNDCCAAVGGRPFAAGSGPAATTAAAGGARFRRLPP